MIALSSFNQLVDDLSAYLKGLLPDISISKDSDAGARIQTLAQALIGLQVNVTEVQKDLFPHRPLLHHYSHLHPNPDLIS